MALTQLTDLQPTNIKVTGIATFDQTVGIAGTLTYEDVTNVDSVGIVTARNGINVSGGTGTFAGNVSIADKIVHTGDTDTAIRFHANDTVSVETGGSQQVTIGANINIISGELTIPDTIRHRNDANTKIRFPADDTFSVETAGSERLRITSTGKVLVNTNTASSVGNSTYSMFEVSGNTSGATGPGHLSLKRGTASASLSDGDTLSRLIFSSLDGGDFAYIQASVDGSPSGSDFPASLRFHTCADGASSSTERLRIASTGNVSINTTNVTEGVLQVNGDISAGILHGGRMYGLLAKRKFDGNNSLAGFAMEYASGYESPYIVAYNNTSSPSINNITFGSLTASDRNLNTGLTKLVEINANSGNMSLNTGNLVIGTSGKGIDFSAQTPTSATGASTTAEILDHYEEGSWTPVYLNVNTPTYGHRSGTYTRIGRAVHCQFQISVDSGLDTSDGSAVNIGGLPFSGNSAHESVVFSFGKLTSIMSNARLAEVTNFRFGGTYIMLHRGSNYDINYTLLNSSGHLQGAFTYQMA